jgi:REP element-mobilizing transposase RayT
MYYVTVRTKNGICVFGEVEENRMVLSPIGEIAQKCWLEMPDHFKNVALDGFQVMPNHLHGILLIIEGETRCEGAPQETPRKDVQLNVPTKDVLSNDVHTRIFRSKFMSQISPQRGTLSVIIRTYKAAVTTICRERGSREFGWQARFYDHVIRDGNDLDRIREYILENPANWMIDDDFPRNIRMDRIHKGKADWSAVA